jgi:hypothetical protein
VSKNSKRVKFFEQMLGMIPFQEGQGLHVHISYFVWEKPGYLINSKVGVRIAGHNHNFKFSSLSHHPEVFEGGKSKQGFRRRSI